MDLEQRLQEIESKLEKSIAMIKELQFENTQLKEQVEADSNFKRPASLAGIDQTTIKKEKLVTPVQNDPESKENTESWHAGDQRREKMRQMFGQFRSKYGQRYNQHLEEERKRCPKLRSNDGTIIKKNIRFIR